ncbi:unnamed protein product [Lactuca saligna]|uniref:Calmodulin-binding domain-containing protein n=1 Tax=Lactuca saligna TaxID=75948 RepID=A0AA35YAF3_LACSI|nr:unnamed protein product [Lactuca saligna]
MVIESSSLIPLIWTIIIITLFVKPGLSAHGFMGPVHRKGSICRFKPSSSQVLGFRSSSLFSIKDFMLVLKTLLHIGMEKIVPDKHSRRHSTGNLAFEYTDVSSRYLKDPVSSCHDNCKPEKSNKTPPISKRIFTQLIPKHSTKDVKTNSASLLKPLPMEPKKQNFLKSKSKIKSTDPFYIPPSTTHRRRYSEILLPTGGLGDVLDQPPAPGLTRSRSSSKKIEPKKDPNSNSKANSVKTLENGNFSKKVQTSKPQKPLVDHGSRKSKPAKPVEEKSDETRISTSDEKVIANDSNETQKDETLRSDDGNESETPSTSKKDETLRSHDQIQSNGGSGGKKPETPRRVGKLVKENGDNLPQKIKLKQGKIVDAQSSGCSTPTKHKLRQQALDEKNQNQNQDDDDDKRGSLRRMPSGGGLQRQGSSKLVNVVLKAQEVEKNKNKQHSGLNNVIEETASKLIQTRKSRVKALVGAFEMISESKL